MMKATKILTDENGKSYFEDYEIDLKDAGDIGFLSENYPVKNIIFRETSENYDYNWHNAPAKQFVIMLEGSVEIEVGSGEKRIFTTGDILLVEDTTGQGHISKAVNNERRKSIFVILDNS
jgi:quercetin dioxygenase-like cupin family protein